ncbi:MAG: M20/M25/M40 family metallo-hydrolase, partial [Bacteroidetes bacterium]|nr:M20/M25/M40 family metallo-hydrolase [Bacteroidota bacterium]
HQKIKTTATKIAESAGATAEVDIFIGNPVTYNNLALTEKVVPTLEAVAGKDNVVLAKAITGAEDFAFYAEKVPSFFFFLGGCPSDKDPKNVPGHHTPDFYLDESGFLLGVRALTHLTLDYMENPGL